MYTLESRKIRFAFSTIYFLTYLALGVYWTYGNIYFREQGLSVSEIGVLNAVYFAVAVIGHPFLGFIYDRSSNKHVVIACTSILAAASGFLVPFQSEPVGRIVVYALFSLFLSSLMPLLDAWSLIWCREGGHSFETIRVWGSYGYLFSSVLGGLALDRAGLVWAYYIPALVLLGICLSVFAFEKSGSLPSQEMVGCVSQSLDKDEIKHMVTRGDFVRLLAVSLLYRIALTGPLSLLSVYFDYRGLSALEIGFGMIIGGLSEMAIIMWNQTLFDYMSDDTLLTVSIISSGIRWLLLISAKSSFCLLATQVFEGLNYMLFYLVAVQKVNDLFPPELAGAGQTIFGRLSCIWNNGR